MPSINRIRVNNVKYNFGTQQYDDFTMRMYGRNTLYDLANGGGKSVLMLLLLQNLIPNCTLDEKQPIEKLFRVGGGNTTIHSLIEWKLDEDESKDGYRYMTTGFCARKAKDSPDEQEGGKGTAAVEYFNYVTFYRDYNDHDIVNLPLVKDGERVSFGTWKNYLKELAHKDLRLEVQVFERKGEYQRFITNYGLYESHWEIIRGINKTEGHVRTYFESHYRTARKVVEDLLIEEIIEKAYQVKTEQNASEETMAHTLLEIKDKLVELSKKKKEIADYDRQTELLNVMEARVGTFFKLYEDQEKQKKNISDAYVTGASIMKQTEQKMEDLKEKRQEQLAEMNRVKLSYESLKIKKDKIKYEELTKEIGRLGEELAKVHAEVEYEEKELKLRESMNEYLDYLAESALCKEHEAYIAESMKDTDTGLGELARMAYARKVRDDKALEAWRKQLAKEEELLTKAEEGLEKTEKDLAKAGEEFGRKQGEATLTEEAYRETLAFLQELRSKMSEESFLDPEELLAAEEEKLKICEAKVAELETWLSDHREEARLAEEEERRIANEIAAAKEQIVALDDKSRSYQQQKEELSRMISIYGMENQAEWLRDEDLAELCAKIRERQFDVAIAKKAAKKDIKYANRRLEDLQVGRMITPSDAAEKVSHYISSRHGMNVQFGMDYLAVQPKETKEALLAAWPMLPYGLILDDLEVVRQDIKIGELPLFDAVLPMYDKKSLAEERDTPSEHVMYLCAGADTFLSEDALKKAIKEEETKIGEIESEMERLTEMEETYKEDLGFVTGLLGMAVLDMEQEYLQVKDNLRALEASYEEKREEAQRCKKELTENEQAWQEARGQMVASLKEQGVLAQMRDVLKRANTLSETAAAAKKAAEAAENEKDAVELRYRHLLRERKDAQGRKAKLDEMIGEQLREYETYFAEYDVTRDTKEGEEYEEGEGPGFVFSDADKEKAIEAYSDMSDEELTAAFKAARAVFEKKHIAVEDKKAWIAALHASMEKRLKSIARRGTDEEDLKKRREDGKLVATDDKELETMQANLAELREKEAKGREKLSSAERQADRVDGGIAQALMTLEERYGSYEEHKATADTIDDLIKQTDLAFHASEHEFQRSEQEYQQYTKQYAEVVELYKDVKRIVETQGISVKLASVQEVAEKDLRDNFETSLKAYDKNVKALAKANQELNQYKNQTAQALTEMSAFELAKAVSDDVRVPTDLGEAKQLKDALHSMIDVIRLEKDRIAQGIEDMEFIKSNFEKQCMERCRDVRSELEKLPKLSRIMLGDESIQMVDLSIPYIKDEFLAQKMSDYIDEVVQGADAYESQNDRIKYIRGKLELKKLFGVTVKDMNNIKLTLYKRERIKEQSRYLRYEEAVGSTGQSQGIYIQFLISIINYISGLYRSDAETTKLSKSIFIDNPFGAAKDVYIWEPIFELLKTNRVQLIVPARGVTPAITARFDVNYVLGQQMVDGKQQTVVVDYRSQVEQDVMEYKNLEYEQATFDFI